MSEPKRHAGNLRLVGGRLCLDFLNTCNHTARGLTEHLHGYGDLLRWCAWAGVFPANETERLQAEATADGRAATQVYADALQVRGALEALFDAAATGATIAPEALATYNQLLGVAPPRTGLVASTTGLHWSGAIESRLDRVLWPILWSAGELLTSPQVRRVRVCAGEGCSWRFLDETPLGNRLWCSMDECGNRAKARRAYARQKVKGKR